MSNLVGTKIGEYLITEELRTYGSATLYKAQDSQLERSITIKIFHINQSNAINFIPAFKEEAKALTQLDHPNLLKIHSFGEENNQSYLVMDDYPNDTLRDRIGPQIPYKQASKLLFPIANALSYAHEQGIIHRDINPNNIFIGKNEIPLLTDFGVVKTLESDEEMDLIQNGLGTGTPDYMAPEQWFGEALPQTDIYALGIIFYEMITGEKPFTDDTPAAILLRQTNDSLINPGSLVENLPPSVTQILNKALAQNPENRFKNMKAFSLALEKLASGEEPEFLESTSTNHPDDQTPVAKEINAQYLAIQKAFKNKKRMINLIFIFSMIFIIFGFYQWFYSQNTTSFQKTNLVETMVSATIIAEHIPIQNVDGQDQNWLPYEIKILLQENFDNPEFKNKYDSSIWKIVALPGAKANQENEIWRFELPSSLNRTSSIALLSKSSWFFNEINIIEANILAKSYPGSGNTFTTISMQSENLSSKLGIQCEIINSEQIADCAVLDENGEILFSTQKVTLESDQWHRVRIFIDPFYSEISFYINSELIGKFEMEDQTAWESEKFQVMYSGKAVDNNDTFIGGFDSILMGQRAVVSEAVELPELKQILVEDQFDDAIFDGTFDQKTWQVFSEENNISGFHQDGTFLVHIPGVEQSPSLEGLISLNEFQVEQLNIVEGRLRIDPNTEDGEMLSFIGLNSTEDDWCIQCGLAGKKSGLICSVKGENQEYAYIFPLNTFEPDQWHTIQIAIEPDTFTIHFFLNGFWLDSFLPEAANRWLSTPFNIVLGSMGESINLSNNSYVDYVIAGNQFQSTDISLTPLPKNITIKEIKDTVLEETFETSINSRPQIEKYWHFSTSGDTFLDIYDDEFHFTVLKNNQGGFDVKSNQSWSNSDLNTARMRFKIDPYYGWGNANLYFKIKPPGAEIWEMGCLANAEILEYTCTIFSGNFQADLTIKDSFEMDTWHTFQISIDPQTFEISFFFDQQFIGGQIPNNASHWKTAPLQLWYGASTHDNSVEFSGSISDIIAGSPD
ncbi:MAG: serine/threonine protein kinase [Anaerolineaceae bacterium]|nr:serine/threonine protein kinase [Anaerolineaceae bacterium]